MKCLAYRKCANVAESGIICYHTSSSSRRRRSNSSSTSCIIFIKPVSQESAEFNSPRNSIKIL